MKDRVSRYPGRVKLTPVKGQENVYDMERADDASVEGTPLNKNTLLKDTTAKQLGLTSDALPDDALKKLDEKIDDVNQTISSGISARGLIKAGTYKGNGSKSQFIDMGFPVVAVLIENEQGSRNESSNSSTSGGLAVKGRSIYHGTTLASVSGSGFIVYNGGQYQGAFNNAGGIYSYIAFGLDQ